MSLPVDDIVAAVASHIEQSGYFDRVQGAEPKNAPGHGLTAAIWVDQVMMIRSSGLDSSSARLLINVRLYTSMLREPIDTIDSDMLKALDSLFTAYAGDFTLGGLVREVDLLGTHGTPLQAQAGYLNQDNKIYRVMTISLPLIVNDVWDQDA